MSKVIIGIHGLSNKPPKDTLAGWWKEAIIEGLNKNTGIFNPSINFESVYWADVMYENPDPQPDAYKAAEEGALKTYDESWLDAVREKVFDWGGDFMDAAKKYLGIEKVADEVLENKLKDLSIYYEEESTRNALRERLKSKIMEHKNKRIMILSHSMGTIVAYDVLRILGQKYPRLLVDHFITLGSPLGLPHVKYKIAKENSLVRTPSIVKRWSNFADKRDPVAFDVKLSGDYAPNSNGVKVVDDLIANDWGGIYHKSYGYLRAPEVSNVIREFICQPVDLW